MGLSVLGCQHGGRHTPVDVSGGAAAVLQLISAGDPFDLAGREVRAGREGEAHRSVSLLWNSTGSGCQGSIPHPYQELTSIDPIIDSGKGSVLLQELSGQAVQVGKGVGKGEGDLPVGVRLIQDVGGEGHQVGCVCSGILQGQGAGGQPSQSSDGVSAHTSDSRRQQ